MKAFALLEGARGNVDSSEPQTFQTPNGSSDSVCGSGVWLVDDSTHCLPTHSDAYQYCHMVNITWGKEKCNSLVLRNISLDNII